MKWKKKKKKKRNDVEKQEGAQRNLQTPMGKEAEPIDNVYKPMESRAILSAVASGRTQRLPLHA